MFVQSGNNYLARLDTASGKLSAFDLPYTLIRNVRVDSRCAVFVGASPTEHPSVVEMDLATAKRKVLRRAQDSLVDPAYVSVAEPVEFPTTGGLTAHAFFYPPTNPDFAAPPGELPPLIVKSHGGPTSATVNSLNYEIQYWTSRGFAVADVNYGGSTGYGRAYRERLNGQWGIVDVDDCANVARYLVDQRRVDPKRLIITGGSAGGFTTLAALAFRDVFTLGSSHFGVSDLEALAKDTHKFESRYLDSMVGPYPERRDLYVERSPIHFTHQLKVPMILFQGLEDVIVPPSQSRLMFEAVRTRELPVALIEYEGEQHGFRKKENIIRTAEAQLYFYSAVFGFDLPEPVEPVEIENLD
jgi:dipeptidyl aminopeptidase/acylaminoacyl peptidase